MCIPCPCPCTTQGEFEAKPVGKSHKKGGRREEASQARASRRLACVGTKEAECQQVTLTLTLTLALTLTPTLTLILTLLLTPPYS